MNCRGFALASVMIALFITTLFFTTTMSIFNHSNIIKKNNNTQYEMVRISQSVIEELKSYINTDTYSEGITFTSYSDAYTNCITIEEIGRDELLFNINASTTCIDDNKAMSVYRIFYINPILHEDYYYTEYPIEP